MNRYDLQGRTAVVTAVVTGGAQGIGRAASGARAALWDRNAELAARQPPDATDRSAMPHAGAGDPAGMT